MAGPQAAEQPKALSAESVSTVDSNPQDFDERDGGSRAQSTSLGEQPVNGSGKTSRASKKKKAKVRKSQRNAAKHSSTASAQPPHPGAAQQRQPQTKGKKHSAFRQTDAGNAEMFAGYHEDDVRFDHKQQRWLIWNTGMRRWVEDKGKRVRLMMKETVRKRGMIAASLRLTEDNEKWKKNEFKWALRSEDRYRIDAALELAKSEPPLSDSGGGWDSNPWLLGVANGILNLRTGKLREVSRQDLITKFSPVKFDAKAKCPRFEKFLKELFGGDRELIRYVQKAAGYSMTGSVNEQCLFACWGSGANGKSTLLEILFYVIGDYGVDLPFSSLEVRRNGSPPGDAVNLPGARFAKSVEIREGKRLDEARIKSLTGGDTISVRPLYRNSFSFRPTHKIWLAVNHKPVITDNSPAMWRRIRLIPFTRTFEGKQAVKTLLEDLKAEASGILNWLIEGCRAWQEDGLEPLPAAIEQATREYESESDSIGPFLEDSCIVGPAESVSSAQLWSVYLNYCTENNEKPLSRNGFGERLKRRGFESGEEGHDKRRVWRGLRLRTEENDAGARVPAGADSHNSSIVSSLKESSRNRHPQAPAREADAENKAVKGQFAGAGMRSTELLRRSGLDVF